MARYAAPTASVWWDRNDFLCECGYHSCGLQLGSCPTLCSRIDFGVIEVVVASFLGTLLLRLFDDHWFGHLGGARRGDGRSKHLNVSSV